jgi:hypothetical protein
MAQACRWRLLVEEIRMEADNFNSESAKETMEMAAKGWEQLAEELERRLARSSDQQQGFFGWDRQAESGLVLVGAAAAACSGISDVLFDRSGHRTRYVAARLRWFIAAGLDAA